MRIRTPIDLGAVIRDRRTKLGLDQKSLAAKVGVSHNGSLRSKRASPEPRLGSSCAPSKPSASLWGRMIPEKQKLKKVHRRSTLIRSSRARARNENDAKEENARTHRHS